LQLVDGARVVEARRCAAAGRRALSVWDTEPVMERCKVSGFGVRCRSTGDLRRTAFAPPGLMSDAPRDVLTPREVAERSGFSYHAILRAIRRGDLQAFEPVAGHYRIELAEYERWLRTPARRTDGKASGARPRDRAAGALASERGSLAALRAIEAKTG